MPDPTHTTITSRIWCPSCKSLTFGITYTTVLIPVGVSENAMHIKCEMVSWEGQCVRPSCRFTMKKEEAENGESEGRS